uniref:Tetratricopeptide repeat protein n=1 Tax=Marseillevirus LCMAC201 TaxID=2506605 RepID=A0A481YX02_9VIRU|nr:MAG: hypothetical protein LCMAC201_02250 [Marseillevirus LCMAC201]
MNLKVQNTQYPKLCADDHECDALFILGTINAQNNNIDEAIDYYQLCIKYSKEDDSIDYGELAVSFR